MDFGAFCEQVSSEVDRAVSEGPPVTYDTVARIWRRAKLRVALELSGAGDTVLASRTAADLFRVSNTLGIRHPLTADGATECAKNVIAWLNNPKLYEAA